MLKKGIRLRVLGRLIVESKTAAIKPSKSSLKIDIAEEIIAPERETATFLFTLSV